ncbi:hypothetical protein EDD36DRAFT_421563 [Exophiala viscosa]|uniref:Cyanovirin-N domain-containing protein n=1 Tax=Exophiala viscosa TaxID=2486360 RepID=A0AAN6DSN9_9EURO|nr:hypothetical protein EDD36DRAFT_421563 [Exophiala viscosa]
MVKVNTLLAAGLMALTAASPVAASPVNPSPTTDDGTTTATSEREVAPLPLFNTSNLEHAAGYQAAEMQKQPPSFTTLIGTRTTSLGTRTTSLFNGTVSEELEPRRLRPGQVVLGCHGKCDKIIRTIDLSLPVPSHSCVRDALTALANWRKYCDNADRWNMGVNFVNFQHTLLCFPNAPNVEVCCGKWVEKDDPKYAVYPPRVEEDRFGVYHPSEVGTKKQVIQPGWDEYNVERDRCRRWRPENEDQYIYYMQNLDKYDIWDADDTGRVIGSNPARYNPEGVGYLVTRANYLAA